jgi:cyclic pyranopterin phosphate synthase
MGPHRLAAGGLSDGFGRPLRDLRISVTDRCNFRCTYCMPAELFGERYEFLPRSEILRFEEIERIARIAVELGATKLRITGGEPLLRAELPRLVERLAALPGDVDLALTTNGVLLPEAASALARAGLRRLSVSLDSADPDVFLRMNGGKLSVDRVLAGIAAAEAAGLAPLKINCVVQRRVNDHTIVDLARRFRGTGHVVRFIEYMDVGNRNGWELAQVVPAAEIAGRLDAELGIEPIERGYRGEVAERWRYRDGSGELGVIASVTRPFCGDCTRARLSADGQLFTCLFATSGHDLRQLLRSGITDDALADALRAIWSGRSDQYSELRTLETVELPKVEMSFIGG